MTIWDYAPHDTSGRLPDPTELESFAAPVARGARGVRRAKLEPLLGVRHDLELLLDELRPAPSLSSTDIESLRTRLEQLTPQVFDSSQPAQAVHGDTGISNVLSYRQRGCCGTTSRTSAPGRSLGRRGACVQRPGHGVKKRRSWRRSSSAYGGPHLEDLVDFIAAHELYATIWHTYAAQRRRGEG